MVNDAKLQRASERYFQEAEELLKRLRSQADAIDIASDWTAESIGNGGLMYLAGTGHSHMIAEEVFYRAGGLVAVNPILEPSLLLDRGAIKSSQLERLQGFGNIIVDDCGFTAQDTLILVSNSGRNAVPIDMALRAKEKGGRIIAIVSVAHASKVLSRHESGKKLPDVADLVIDTGVAYGDASLEIEGFPHRVGPLSTIAGVTIINAIVVRVVEKLVLSGKQPEVFSSANLAVERAIDVHTLRRSQSRIRSL